MMKSKLLSKSFRHGGLSAMALFASLAVALALPASAVTVTGVVTNGTTHKPAAGDTVVLIALSQSMQEVAHTKSDARGHFSLTAPDAGMHLVRVDHQKAAYFQPVPPNASNVNVEIFDVAPEVTGVTTEANVMRVETDQQGLRITQSFFVKNASNPPRTQFSNHSYEIYLPPGVELESSAAMGPGGMPVQAAPAPLADKGHYAFLFPLRPGETQFQLSYRLPYSGSLAFTPRLASPAANFVVMLPTSMSFKPDSGASFQTIDAQTGAQTFLIRNATPSQSLAFTVSGSGAMPRDSQAASAQGGSGQGAASPNSAAADNRPGIGLGPPIDTPDPLNKYKWWILGGIAIIFAIGAAFLLRKPTDSEPVSVPASGSTLLAALRDELFAIEADRVQGKLSDSEYGELKSALELVLRRALARQPA